MSTARFAIAILRKDLIVEFRSRYAINTVLAFVVSATLVVLFALDTRILSDEIYSGLLWIIILFASMSSLSRSFVMETDKQTFDLLRLHTPGLPVYTGKLIYNILFTTAVTLLTFSLLFLLTGAFSEGGFILLLILILGAIGFSSVSTLIASLVSRASRKGSIFTVLCLPLLLPLIMLLTTATRNTLGGAEFFENGEELLALTGYCGVTITLSVLLFEYVWND